LTVLAPFWLRAPGKQGCCAGAQPRRNL
jgi:hypothetical protein